MLGQPLYPDPLTVAGEWHADGRGVAIATVIETWGSAPRPVGSHLVSRFGGEFSRLRFRWLRRGAVIVEAADVITSGTARILEFGVADETAWRVGLSCGGRIRIYVERLG